jgi:hypothetical protein
LQCHLEEQPLVALATKAEPDNPQPHQSPLVQLATMHLIRKRREDGHCAAVQFNVAEVAPIANEVHARSLGLDVE